MVSVSPKKLRKERKIYWMAVPHDGEKKEIKCERFSASPFEGMPIRMVHAFFATSGKHFTP